MLLTADECYDYSDRAGDSCSDAENFSCKKRECPECPPEAPSIADASVGSDPVPEGRKFILNLKLESSLIHAIRPHFIRSVTDTGYL